MARTRLEWDPLAWGYLEEWSAPIPGQPAGTTVCYAIWATTVTGVSLACPFVGSEGAAQRQGSAAAAQLTTEFVV